MSGAQPGSRRPRSRGRAVGVPAVASIASLVGLVLVAVLSLGLLGWSIPDIRPGGNGGAAQSIDPTNVHRPGGNLPTEQRPNVRGTILVVKAGNIWALSGRTDLKQLTTTGADSEPSWSPDGSTIYFVQTLTKKAMVPYEGHPSPYTLEYPAITRMNADGSGRKKIQDGLYSLGGGQTYFSWLLQPDVSPDGKTFALVSDSTDPFTASIALSTMPVAGGKVTRLGVGESYYYYGLGHNDPTWSPNGRTIAYTYNDKVGALGMPRIALYDVRKATARFLTTNGYGQPSWSPDGRYIAAVRTSAKGRDVVILDASKGTELLRLTNDGKSFAPVWSPAGDQIAYLRAQGLSIDLELASISGAGSRFSVTRTEALTAASQLDGTSRPAWFVPADQLPPPTATPAPPSATAPASGASTGP